MRLVSLNGTQTVGSSIEDFGLGLFFYHELQKTIPILYILGGMDWEIVWNKRFGEVTSSNYLQQADAEREKQKPAKASSYGATNKLLSLS